MDTALASKISIAAISMAFGNALAPKATAQDFACAFADPDFWLAYVDTYAGDWTANHHSGFVAAQGHILPFPASNENEAVSIIAVSDGSLLLDHPQLPEPLEMTPADEPPWAFEADAESAGMPEPLLSSKDVEAMMGCPNSDMARLIGRTSATVNGYDMNFTYRLMIVGADHMYGIMHLEGVADGNMYDAWRTVALTR